MMQVLLYDTFYLAVGSTNWKSLLPFPSSTPENKSVFVIDWGWSVVQVGPVGLLSVRQYVEK